jgi:hypothetical protein
LIAKNEAPYLIEWIAYHRIIGFDEVIVYENNSNDASAAMLQKLDRRGAITHRRWTLGGNESPQLTAYQDAFRRVKTNWILFIDADEFLVLHKHRSVNAFLESLDGRADISAIGINWRIFGSSGLQTYDDRPVMERFVMAAESNFIVNSHLKTFTRVADQSGIVHMHVCGTTGALVHPSGKPLTMSDWGLSKDIELDVAQINHYYTKTPAEYENKRLRGQGGAGDNKPDLKYWYNEESFIGHDRNDIEDRAILERFDEVRAEMARLNALLKG